MCGWLVTGTGPARRDDDVAPRCLASLTPRLDLTSFPSTPYPIARHTDINTMSSAEGLKQRKGAKKEEEKPLLDKEDKAKPVVRRSIDP